MAAEAATAGFQISPQQKHVWTTQRNQAGVAQVAVILEGCVDVQRLQESLRKVVQRHEILRTSFRRNTGMTFPFQVVSPESDFIWTESDSPVEESDLALIDRLLTVRVAIDASISPNFYCDLVQVSPIKHFLILSMPGLSADSAGLQWIVRDLRDEYAGESRSGPDPIQYADYSEWQNELLLSTDDEAFAAREYWNQNSPSTIPSLRLPFEAKSGVSTGSALESVPVPVDDRILERLEAANGGELPLFLFAAWQVLAYRLSGQAGLVIAELSDGRHLEELENAVGLFAKALPRYADLQGNPPFAKVISALRERRTQAVGYVDYVEPSALGCPVGFSADRWATIEPAQQVTFSICKLRCFIHPFHIQLRFGSSCHAWSLELLYDSAFFQKEVVQGFAMQLRLLLEAALAEPYSPIGKLSTIDEEERRHILVDFNATNTEYPRDKGIQKIFEEQAARTPSRIALRDEQSEYSYSALNSKANQLARALRGHNVGANVPVGLFLERSADMVVSLLGILKAGGCYLPLIPDSPKERTAHQLEETKTSVVITTKELMDRLPHFAGKIICVDRDAAVLDAEPTSNLVDINSPSDLVYVIYTSGSTGKPKGVAVRHSNLVNYAHFICQLLQMERHPQGLQFATVSTLSADLGNTSIFPALISGGCLHVISNETAMAANLFADYVTAHPIDVLKITPSHLSTLLGFARGAQSLPRKYLFLGGEACSWDLVTRVQNASSCTVINHYGPTEATVGCCTYSVQENDVTPWSPATVPIGRPIANDQIYILDAYQQPTNVGVPGEIYIGGAGVAKEYLNLPEQTNERFVPNQFSLDADAKVYRTGDLGRFLPDGNIEFLGRLDHQVKIRGFRVEPAEIEAVLKRHPNVVSGAVVPYDNVMGNKLLAAYFVANRPIATEDLREFLSQRLPNYMIPSALVPMISLPLTANGKLDLVALPSPEEDQVKQTKAIIAPRNSTEAQLVEIWKEVLKIHQVSIDDNFFELGGHSLLATQIISRIRNGFRIQMPLHSFLESPTIVGLAEKISECPPAESEEDEMARLLLELEGLSEEEAELLLATDLDNFPTLPKKTETDL